MKCYTTITLFLACFLSSCHATSVTVQPSASVEVSQSQSVTPSVSASASVSETVGEMDSSSSMSMSQSVSVSPSVDGSSQSVDGGSMTHSVDSSMSQSVHNNMESSSSNQGVMDSSSMSASVSASQSMQQNSDSASASINPTQSSNSVDVVQTSAIVEGKFSEWSKDCENLCCKHKGDGGWEPVGETMKINVTRTCAVSVCTPDSYNSTLGYEATCKEACDKSCNSAALLKISSMSMVILSFAMLKNIIM